MRRFLPVTVALAAVLLAALTLGVAPAAAKGKCWQKLLNDEYDGRIDGTYPVYCYHEALKHLHEDVRTYGSAYNDIQRALESAVLGYSGHHGGGSPPPGYPVPAETGASTHNHPENFFQRIANAIGPGNATSIPLPLLILAGVGLLLVAAAGASYVARRIRARRTRPQPATFPPTPRR
jgi:hypothetical protein